MNIILFDHMPEGGLIPISDERARHIVNILHLKEGDLFKMGILNSSEGPATITRITEAGVHFTYEPQTKPTLHPVTLLCAQVRPICMKRILREAVSLGVQRIVLCGSDTGEKSYLGSNLYTTGEYRDYLLDGAMQSSHAGMPDFSMAGTVDGAIELVKKMCGPESDRIMLDNVAGAVPLGSATVRGNAVLAVGPERGWSDRERRVFMDNGYRPMLLGSRVIRTETASSVGIGVLLGRLGLL